MMIRHPHEDGWCSPDRVPPRGPPPPAADPRAPGESYWLRVLGVGKVRWRWYRVSIALAVRLCGQAGYQVRLANAEELLAEGFELEALHSAPRGS